ncbi:hypothetical protein [Luteolibacter soli]|uniref:Uncharacterized protein n=1 Tax=Luteolibacter soli TaxID=3135280 RepID=A0ABU9AW64_9BACT
MEIVLNSRVVPGGLRKVVERVVRRFTFRPQFRWMATPSEEVVLCLPPLLVESVYGSREKEGVLLRAGIEDEIRREIESLLPFTEAGAAEARK